MAHVSGTEQAVGVLRLTRRSVSRRGIIFLIIFGTLLVLNKTLLEFLKLMVGVDAGGIRIALVLEHSAPKEDDGLVDSRRHRARDDV